MGQHLHEIEQERRELIRALVWMERATCQGHSAHWDPTGGAGAGCPVCKRADEQRGRAESIIKRATGRGLCQLATDLDIEE